ncbi:MAG: bifunctional [glutamine synthetase] adenylyltransferase/[glutamine synthetase]-adenylyl-L-tyrosine phosphorylase [Mycobacteriales bacterium]
MTPPAEQPRGSTSPARLTRLGFYHAERAMTLLGTGGLGLWDADRGPVDEGARQVVVALADAANPDLAAAALSRLAEVVEHPTELLGVLRDSDDVRRRLVGVLGASAALGDHLVRHPADWETLRDDVLAPSRPSALGLQRTLLSAVGADPADPPWGSGGARAAGTGDDVLSSLRAAYRRCLLRLAARDLSGEVSVEEVAGELADLAAAALSAGLAVALAALPADAPGCRLAVIGMGKAGGRELNYVSDVDVVFVAEPLEDGRGGAPADEAAALRTATTLAIELMRAVAVETTEGALWPVDAALRPEGKAGPLVRTLASHEAYYRRWARTWEFQALLKARPLAGDLVLGGAYVDRLAPLVWVASQRPHFVEDVQAMRRRVEDALSPDKADREVKLGPGGLRDVEFAVQLLQLVHGRADVDLRSGTTLVALDALAAYGYIGREDARRLGESYRFLRTVEHRLQLQRLRRTHLVPTDPAELRWLARALGYRPGPYGDAVTQFTYERAAYAREVRLLHEKLFYRPLLGAVEALPADEAGLLPPAARTRLEALGFADPAGALRHLEALTAGLSRRAVIQRRLLPTMLAAFADAADPDAGLLAYRQVSEALGTTPWYLRLLRDEGDAADRLARLLAGSRYVAGLLARAPEAVALLARDSELVPRTRAQLEVSLVAGAARREDWVGAVLAARGVRRQELLRVAGADLLGRLDLASVGAALSDVAAATIAAALATAMRGVAVHRGGSLPMRIAVIAMGRLGGREQGYGSDADVLFVHEPADGASDEEAAVAATAVATELRRLLALPAPDPPLLVDAGLRPEGRQGPLSRSLAAYTAYYSGRSSIWEAQALLRASRLAGDDDLAGRFLDGIDPVRWPRSGLTDADVIEIRRIKARVEAERLPRGADPSLHTKLGRGGLSDVEWTVQLIQLRHAAQVPALRTTSTLEALAGACEAGLLDRSDAEALETAWSLAAHVRNAIMLIRGRPGDVLPTVGRDLAGVARAMGYPAGTPPYSGGTSLLEDYRRTTRRARTVVERVFYA